VLNNDNWLFVYLAEISLILHAVQISRCIGDCDSNVENKAVMKELLCMLTLAAALFPGVSQADASRCYAIRDVDIKNNCLATVKHDKSRCYAIKDRDLKSSCLARVGNDKSRCYSIKNKDQKQQCLAEF